MKKRIFFLGTIILIIIILLAFFIGCNTSSDPSTPGGKQALVGTWVEIEPGIYKEVFIFTLDTFVNPFYVWYGSSWVLDSSLKGTLSVSGDLLTLTAEKISYDGTNWGAYGPQAMTFGYSISNNELTLTIGSMVYGVYIKQ